MEADPISELTPIQQGLFDDLTAPTPYHAAERAGSLLAEAGFSPVDLGHRLTAEPGSYYAIDGGTLVAWIQHPGGDGFRVVGAHTDSPNLRVRTRPDVTHGGWSQVGMEVYGGVLLNSWLDRDLGLAGRVVVKGDGGPALRLYRDDRPLLRIPQLAIHLDREIRERGLKVDPQKHLTPLWAVGDGDEEEGAVRAHVADGLGVDPDDILAWDLMAHDVQPPAVVGRRADLYSAARIDNLVSAFCATRALALVHHRLSSGDGSGSGLAGPLPVMVLYDHEEIGSETATGAGGPLLAGTLERISQALGRDRADHLAALTRSLVISADGAHATNPNYVDRHEPSHLIGVNAGVVIKRNANQRYATDAASESVVVAAAEAAGVPLQYYIHRNDLPCGSTIGPITAARLGVATVDIGAPQLAMHSIREMGGLADLDHLHDLLVALWSPEG